MGHICHHSGRDGFCWARVLTLLSLFAMASVTLVAVRPVHAANGSTGAADAKPPYNKVYALCIGINQYASPLTGGDLKQAENDASAMHRLFKDRFGYDTILLLGSDATKARIESAIQDRLAAVQDEDVLIVFYAGHGRAVATESKDPQKAFEGYILPQDLAVTSDNLYREITYQQGAVSMRKLAEDLKQSRAKHVLLILDCCASGLAARGSGLKIKGEYVKALAEHRTRQIITAGKGDQKAYEYGEHESVQHGIFTAMLMQALTREPVQPITSFFPRLQESVFTEVQSKFGDRVIPQRKLLIDEGGDYVFIQKGVQLDWREEVHKQESDGRSRGYPETGDGDVKQARETAAQPSQTKTDDPTWKRRAEDYERRAAAGDAKAMEALAYCYRAGLGVPRDSRRAYYWAREANDAGRQGGTYLLSRLLSEGAAGKDVDPGTTKAFASTIMAALPPKDREDFDRWGNILFADDPIAALAANNPGKTERDRQLFAALGVLAKSITSESRRTFRSRLDRIDLELQKRITDWTLVQNELRAWRKDVQEAMESAPEAQRMGLGDLDQNLNQLQSDARFNRKTQVRDSINAAREALNRAEAAGAGSR